MKKIISSICMLVFLSSVALAGSVSFKSAFIKMPGWQIKTSERTELFNSTGMAACQGFYVKGIKKVVASIAVGKLAQKSPGNPVGYSFSYGGLTMKVIKKFGFVTMITFNDTKKSGTIVGFFPVNNKQKYYGMLTFAFNNVSLAEAKNIAYKFNWYKIQKLMAKVQ